MEEAELWSTCVSPASARIEEVLKQVADLCNVSETFSSSYDEIKAINNRSANKATCAGVGVSRKEWGDWMQRACAGSALWDQGEYFTKWRQQTKIRFVPLDSFHSFLNADT